MRIGIYDPYLDDMGGGEKYILSIASCLSDEHEVSLFWNSKDDLEKVNHRFNINLSKVNLTANIFSKSVPLVKRLVESRKYDVIILISDGSIPTLFSKKLFLHFQQPVPGFRKDFKTKFKLKKVNKIFCNSYFTKSYIDRDLGVESTVIYPPVELSPKKVKKENIILHVGRFRVANVGISDYKKQGVLIDAFKKLIKKGVKGWKFVLAVSVNEGEYDQFEKMQNDAKDFPIEFEINKTNEELWEIYSKAKIYWHASGFGEDLQNHPEYAEHFGISTVEAMGAGCAPVVIRAGGQKEIVEDNENGFLWDSIDELLQKTQVLISEEKILENMSKEAVKRSHEFAGDRFCEEIRKLI